MAAPLEITEVLVNTHSVQCPPRRIRETGDDDGSVPLQGDHRISLIGVALTYIASGMRVYVGKDTKALIPAVLPEHSVANGVKNDSAAVVGVGIKIVVADERGHPVGTGLL